MMQSSMLYKNIDFSIITKLKIYLLFPMFLSPLGKV